MRFWLVTKDEAEMGKAMGWAIPAKNEIYVRKDLCRCETFGTVVHEIRHLYQSVSGLYHHLTDGDREADASTYEKKFGAKYAPICRECDR